MTRNEELIEKYKRYIKKIEKQIETLTAPQALPLIAKVSVYNMVIIDLQECENEAISFTKDKLKVVGGLLSEDYKIGYKEGVEHYLASKNDL
jgi:hypothetical protein